MCVLYLFVKLFLSQNTKKRIVEQIEDDSKTSQQQNYRPKKKQKLLNKNDINIKINDDHQVCLIFDVKPRKNFCAKKNDSLLVFSKNEKLQDSEQESNIQTSLMPPKSAIPPKKDKKGNSMDKEQRKIKQQKSSFTRKNFTRNDLFFILFLFVGEITDTLELIN